MTNRGISSVVTNFENLKLSENVQIWYINVIFKIEMKSKYGGDGTPERTIKVISQKLNNRVCRYRRIREDVRGK